MNELILHLFGDYITQSNWMAQSKTKRFFPAFLHALIYSLPFLMIGSVAAWSVIFSTHFLIDRYRLARFVVFAKNHLSPRLSKEAWTKENENGRQSGGISVPNWHPWAACKATGYHESQPAWLTVWLLIAADNTLHLAINHLSLKFL